MNIKELAHKAGFNDFPNDENGVWITDGYWDEQLERFAELVAAAERDACAKLCEEYADDKWNLYKGRSPYTGKEDGRADPHVQGENCGAMDCAAAIRARGDKHE